MAKKSKSKFKPLPGMDFRVSAADKPHNADLADVKIETPDGERVTASKSLRDDPLGRLHARKQISDGQAAAGDYAREMFELFGSDGVRAMDFAKPFVDGGSGGGAGITDRQMRAAKRLKEARDALGSEGFQLVVEVLNGRKFIEAVARERGLNSQRDIDYLAKRFRECLDTLASVFGFTVRGADRRPVRDKHSKSARHANKPELHRAILSAQEHARDQAPARTVGDNKLTLKEANQ